MMDDLLQKESEEVTYMAHMKDVNSQHMKESQMSHILPAHILVILIERYLKQKNESRLQIVWRRSGMSWKMLPYKSHIR